jgi:hypothetical protein
MDDDDNKLGFMCYERPAGEVEPPPDTRPALDTDEADSYRSSHCETFRSSNSRGYVDLPVAEHIWGKPWNGLALNVVQSLWPDGAGPIRVVTGGECVTCDGMSGRVTVTLSTKDSRTIERITQEVTVGLRGCRCGSDVLQLLAGKELKPMGGVIANTAALERVDLESAPEMEVKDGPADPECEKCGGTGFSGDGVLVPCDCRRRKR